MAQPVVLARIKDYQTLVGASVALGAAIIAFGNVHRQIAAAEAAEVQRKIDAGAIEEERRRYDRSQLASALHGELTAFASLVEKREMVAYYTNNAARVRETGKFEFWSLALQPSQDVIFRSVGAQLGKLPGRLPTEIVQTYAEIAALFERMRAAREGDYNGLVGAPAAEMIENIAREAAEASASASAIAGKLLAI